MSKTSFFHKAVFKKNLTRFFPLYFLYTVMLAILVPNMFRLSYFSHSATGTAILCFLFGTVTAVRLFSYLYKAPSANMFASFPVTRKAYFWTNVLSGVLFALGPNMLIALIFWISRFLPSGALFVPALFRAFTHISLSYLLPFAVGVLAAVCAGTSFGAWLLALILQFGALALETCRYVVIPMLYGVESGSYISAELSPSYWLIAPDKQLAPWGPNPDPNVICGWDYYYNWGLLAIIVGAILLALLLAYFLYKRRPMEGAGDLIAFPWLKPVFKYVYALLCAVLFGNLVLTLLFWSQMDPIGARTPWPVYFSYIAVGCASYFVAEMLLEKSPRVFRRKYLLRCAGVGSALALALLCVQLDVGRITWRLPDTEEIEAVTLNVKNSPFDSPWLTEERDIEEVRDLHRLFLDNRDELGPRTAIPEWREDYDRSTVVITYRLKNGDTMHRSYTLVTAQTLTDPDDLGKRLNALLNRRDFAEKRLFWRTDLTGMEDLEAHLLSVNLRWRDTSGENWETDPKYEDPILLIQPDAQLLLEALERDLDAGNVMTLSNFAADLYEGEESLELGFLDLSYQDPLDPSHKKYFSIGFPLTARYENLLAALEALGYPPPEV